MKSTILAISMLGIGFIGGFLWEYTADRQSLDEIEQVAQESCDVRIKVIRENCKK